jgi:alcohol dehydrogenase class IV
MSNPSAAPIAPFAFATPPRVMFGAGHAGRLGDLAGALLGGRIAVVTDRGVRGAGLLDAALASLAATGAELAILDSVVADPPESVVLAAVAEARAFGATGVLGLGGGSPLDVAKLVALLARSDERLDAIYGVGLAQGPRLPLVLVPTTAGTGSEVTPIAIVTTGAAEKKGVVAPVLLPDLAVLDPDLTLGLGPATTAATGIDAMVHAIEAFTSRGANANPVSRALAREALALLGRHIRAAVHQGQDRAARAGMLLGSMLAGQAFANAPVAAVHALAYPLGGHFHLPHGLTNALVLPHVLRFNAGAAEAEYADLAPILFPHLAGHSLGRRCSGLIEGLAGLSAELGLPARLSEVDVPRAMLPVLAADAMKQTRLLVNNPRALTLADATAIYEAAW